MKLSLLYAKLLLILLCCKFNGNAQVDESKNFIYFDSDSIQYAQRVRAHTGITGRLQLRADGKQVPLSQVKFFNADQGFFAMSSHTKIFEPYVLSERLIRGRINVFIEIPEAALLRFRAPLPPSTDGYAPNGKMFYNKEYGELKKLNYKNLRLDLQDSPASINLLENYRKKQGRARALYVGAGVTLAAAALSFFTRTADLSSKPVMGAPFSPAAPAGQLLSVGLLGAGAGLAAGGYFAQQSAMATLQEALDEYNNTPAGR